MGRIISFITMMVVGILVILFSITNRQSVALDLWPLPLFVDVPIYAVVIAAAVIGFIAGGIVAWFSGGRARRRARVPSCWCGTCARSRYLYLLITS